jgi:hypothetical protein
MLKKKRGTANKTNIADEMTASFEMFSEMRKSLSIRLWISREMI